MGDMYMVIATVRRDAWGLALGVLLSVLATTAMAAEPIKVGMVAALSGQSAKSGEGITRGLTIAIDEINKRGGVLGGRMLELIRRDDESNPSKGQVAALELIHKEKVAMLFGGIDSPVSLAIVPIANKEKIPFMGVWAAATPITRNGANPNFVFRVSAVDVLVDKALVQYAITRYGAKRLGLLLINNPWGESNAQGLTAAIEETKLSTAGMEKFEPNDVDMVSQLSRLKAAQADGLILVATVAPGAQVVKALARMGWQVPVISHWGISGGRFPELAGPAAQHVEFVQTYSFFGPQSEVGQRVLTALQTKYPDIKGPGDVIPPVGVANAYDAMHLMALAVEKAGSTEGEKIRQGLYAIDTYQGLIKTYSKPFSPDNHDALNEHDYIMVHYVGDQIEPIAK
jgi:branched-chain amino acid transport system substrate-binding protein